ncbi:MAG: hypothetical protein WBA24_20370 [Geitlerinemataceae cyanobacterium]
MNSISRGYSGVQVNALSSTMLRLPDLSLSPIRWVCATPAAIVAPQPGVVARLAYNAGAAFLAVRPSLRSFSRWVCVVYFASATVAESFACACASRFGFPFCRVRALGSWWGVSVPVCIRQWSCVAGSLPYLVVSLMASERLTTDE